MSVKYRELSKPLLKSMRSVSLTVMLLERARSEQSFLTQSMRVSDGGRIIPRFTGLLLHALVQS